MPRRGTTLLDLLLTLVVIGILLATSLPRMAALRDAAAVRAARADLLIALDAARGAALRLGTEVELRDDGQQRLLIPALTDSTPAWVGPAASRHGVTLTGLTRPIAFGPAGIAIGAANRTLRLRRGTITMAVVLSRLGRVR